MAHREFPHVQSGRIVHVDELAARPAAELVGSSVRVLGRVESVDARESRVVIGYHGARLAVSTELLPDVGAFKTSALFQFVGELTVEAQGELVLNTRLAIPMAGLNTDLYDRCLQMRRDFERDCLPR